MTGNTLQITPFMQVPELAGALRFLTETIGFEVAFRQSNYAYLEREGAALRVLENTDPAEQGAPHRGFAYYIDVKSVEVVVEQIGERLKSLPAGHVHGPVDQPYGQRELMIRAPDGNVLVFGAAIEES